MKNRLLIRLYNKMFMKSNTCLTLNAFKCPQIPSEYSLTNFSKTLWKKITVISNTVTNWLPLWKSHNKLNL